jgi:hypothetical protein
MNAILGFAPVTLVFSCQQLSSFSFIDYFSSVFTIALIKSVVACEQHRAKMSVQRFARTIRLNGQRLSIDKVENRILHPLECSNLEDFSLPTLEF